MKSDLQWVQARVVSLRDVTPTVREFELQPEASPAAAHEPGAHLQVQLMTAPGRLQTRSYSLVGEGDGRCWRIAVKRLDDGRGGSRAMWRLAVGDRLQVSAPQNHFPLDLSAPGYLLVAGGIGITPLWAMVQRLVALDRPWELHYAARSRRSAAFVDALRQLPASLRQRVHLRFDDEQDGLLDLAAIRSHAPQGAHFYCCGPAPMMAAFQAALAGLPSGRIHLEHFKAAAPVRTDGGFEVELARSGRVLAVGAGRSILDVVLDAGVDVPHSCMEGICGSCEVGLLAGDPDHRDMVLSESQRQANRSMLLCCSGALSSRLVLDL